MNKILKKTYFSERVVQLVVEAPLIARSRKPGNFVIVRVGEKGERMPLTISDADEEKGTITLVVQKIHAENISYLLSVVCRFTIFMPFLNAFAEFVRIHTVNLDKRHIKRTPQHAAFLDDGVH